MVREFASEHAQIILSAIVFGISFFLFIGWLVWSNLISKKYIKHCEDMTKNDE